MLGTIEHRWGHPEYLALDVRLDDGQVELFWAHGLESAEDRSFPGPTIIADPTRGLGPS